MFTCSYPSALFNVGDAIEVALENAPQISAFVHLIAGQELLQPRRTAWFLPAYAASCCYMSVTDYDELRQSAAVTFAEKAAEVRATVAKLERAQQKGVAALELFTHGCKDQFA